MDESTPQDADTVGATLKEPTAQNGAKLSRTRGLRPPWRPGQSGNPSGLTRDGESPKGQKLQASLLDELERSGGMAALAKRWVTLAKKGNSTALSAILERLYPVPQEDGSKGRVVLESLTLELHTHAAPAPPVHALQAHGSDALSDASESRRGGSAMVSSGVPPILEVPFRESPLPATPLLEAEKADGCLETPG